MSSVNLKKLLNRKEISPIIHGLIVATDTPMIVQDTEEQVIFGDPSLISVMSLGDRQPIGVADEVIGWVTSVAGANDKVCAIASTLSFFAIKDIERKRVADEILSKYKELNLFHQLSEKITASLELSVVCELIIQEARKLIKTTSGSVMLQSDKTGQIEVISSFGQAVHSNFKVTPGEGIAGSVFLSGKGEIVNDVISDPRFVPGPNPVSSLICAPLKTRDRVIGVVNFSHAEPIVYSSEDLQLLATLASQAAQAIENAVLHETQIKDAVARNEIEKGRKMQQDFLPDHILQPQGWELAATFKPAREVAGDFYDTFMLPSGGIGLVIADVCDKGVGSALFMALFRSLIRVFSSQANLSGLFFPVDDIDSKKQIPINLDHVNALSAVRLTNDYVAQNHSNLNMFATLFFGVLDPTNGMLIYINGGHEPLVVLGKNGEIKSRLKPTGPAVGMMPNMHFRIQQVHLEIDDMLLGYTDGVTEAKSPSGGFFTEKKLLSLLDEPVTSASALLERIEENLLHHIAGVDQFDDITMLAIQRNA